MLMPLFDDRLSDDRRTFRAIWRVFRAQPLKWRIILPAGLVLAGLLEGLGLALFLPMMVASVASQSEPSALMTGATGVLAWVGLPANLGVLLGLCTSVIVLKAALLLFVMRQVAGIVAGSANQIRTALVDALLTARWCYFTRQSVGRLATVIGGESDRAANVFYFGASLAAETLQAIVFLGLALLIAWQVTLGAVLVGLIAGFGLLVLLKLSRAAGERQTRLLGDLGQRLVDALVTLKPLKATARETLLRPFLARDIEALTESSREVNFIQQAAAIVQEPLLVVAVGLTLALAVGFGGTTLSFDTLLALGLLLQRAAARLFAVQRSY
ncbi:MAG: ABC transporter ATP-binding protein, partial [Gammaproteobacteria bacterium]|nr:ABC transporter ATP-binding protein [Gammaproteobacteria bacterium]